MKNIKFPQDFSKEDHPISISYPNTLQFKYPKDGDTVISVIFGYPFYSNGVDTYEMYDFREDEPQGYLTIDQINEHLKNNPL